MKVLLIAALLSGTLGAGTASAQMGRQACPTDRLVRKTIPGRGSVVGYVSPQDSHNWYCYWTLMGWGAKPTDGNRPTNGNMQYRGGMNYGGNRYNDRMMPRYDNDRYDDSYENGMPMDSRGYEMPMWRMYPPRPYWRPRWNPYMMHGWHQHY